ncbi:biogenesis of lysosome-related organelles complex 1 subunit 5 isoform X2 [Diabrotica virgifera virgifera]|uniref:Biogenesis of lysosome-related organelles complex 1 subunit 5 n=1 Tax=Diabrotica virgifera virgifera TaxID=50390 RepID=A0A6P7FC24_DIAVI|nr:biogenesis of lysosome-related organelles complex 1 subunit 5 isoform X2 [Diabrotica virgifera virgifera]
MSEVVKDVGKIWDRLFDHRPFLNGEISLILQAFEQRRKDKEVDNLFKAIEEITEIKDTEIEKLKQAEKLTDKINDNLEEALRICDKFSELEETYKQSTPLEQSRNKRKLDWDKFMGGITTKYSEINSQFETREEELKKFYEDIEKKLLI